MSKFTHLHTHSHYSLLNALPKIPALVAAAKKDGMEALALTDNGNLYGAIEFYKECKKNGIKPIIGIDAYVALRGRRDQQAGIDNQRSRLVLLAKDLDGYRNLLKLVTASYLEGFYYRPRIDKELIEKHHAGLIAIMPSFSGDIANALKHNDKEKARETLDWYQKNFGKEDFYLEITHHPEIDGHQKNMESLVNFGSETGTPLVAAHDVYYLDPSDKAARETLISIQTNTPHEKSALEEEKDFSFIKRATAEKHFKDLPEALANTEKIAEKCNLELSLGTWVFPDYPIPKGATPEQELKKAVTLGLVERALEETSEVKNRIEYELGIINEKGFAPYFLTVADLLRFAREHNILTTTRGSAAGSLVSYLTGITNINPLFYKLPFERFLNPERPKAPDIDMDFADDRRDEVIAYAKEKYGEDKVAQIGTFGTMMARGAVRDVARALGYSYGTGDRIAKAIPFGSQGFPMTIDKAIEITPELKDMYKNDTDTRTIIDMAKKIEGCARHISVHAAGVVIAPKPLTNYVPLQFDPKGGKIITQYDMHAIEEAGLLKFDFLGIRNLAILADAVKRVKKLRDIDVDIENIPLDDKKTFKLLAKGETGGLFQLNGSGMTRFLKELKPSAIYDINAMVALYRPGPMESIPRYIERKHNPKLIKYLDPRMKDILSQSYGVITYQDDVMMIAIKLGGYSWLEADKLRKAMGKKIPEEMEAQREKLTEGFIENGTSEETAEKLWKLIEPFAAYGFNKAHAASYGRVAYQTAYMKANFPVIYMASVLSAEAGDTEKIAEIISECKRMEIPVLPPDINQSLGDFTVVKSEHGQDRSIRFGLYTIKNFGEGIANTIIALRKEHGEYKSIADFLDRVRDRNLNKKSLESLIKCGAMDELGERGTLLGNLEKLLEYNKEGRDGARNQGSLFGLMNDQSSIPELTLEKNRPANQSEKLLWEKELLGLYISGHPLDKHREKLNKQSKNISTIAENTPEGVTTVIAGIIEDARDILTKKGDRMMFLKIADLNGSIETVVFPRVYESYKTLLTPENCIAIKGRFSKRNGTPSIIAEKVKAL